MLTKEENELLTRINGDAPMGRMLRQHWWIPAALSEKLVADGKPQRVRLFGMNYVAFRATDGKVGFFDEACPHRGASMALARNEDNALRCIYHGWKFSVDGVTVAVPTQPRNEAEFCKHVPLKHFPVREEAGVVWVWLGETGEPPAFPKFEFMGLNANQTVAVRQKVNANWLQGVETTMDSAHLGVLHQSSVQGLGDINFSAANQAPVYQLEPKPYGFRYASIRALQSSKFYVRTNSFVLPWYGVIAPARSDMQGGNFFFSVPIDDENIWYWHIAYRKDGPFDRSTPDVVFTDPESWPPAAPGGPDDNWGQDRALMAQGHFTGFPQHLGTEDFAVIASMGPIVDRTKETLGAGDGAVVQVRRCLLGAVRAFMDGQTPELALHEHIAYPSIRPLAAVFERADQWKETL
jgi:phthalate 4,5-dioxygenase oxygenase subunit